MARQRLSKSQNPARIRLKRCGTSIRINLRFVTVIEALLIFDILHQVGFRHLAKGHEELYADQTRQVLQAALGSPVARKFHCRLKKPASETEPNALVWYINTSQICLNSRELLQLCVRAFVKSK